MCVKTAINAWLKKLIAQLTQLNKLIAWQLYFWITYFVILKLYLLIIYLKSDSIVYECMWVFQQMLINGRVSGNTRYAASYRKMHKMAWASLFHLKVFKNIRSCAQSTGMVWVQHDSVLTASLSCVTWQRVPAMHNKAPPYHAAVQTCKFI